jgi:hypothetical protein
MRAPDGGANNSNRTHPAASTATETTSGGTLEAGSQRHQGRQAIAEVWQDQPPDMSFEQFMEREIAKP